MILHLKSKLVEIQQEYNELYDFNHSMYFTIDNNFCIQRVNFKAAQFLNLDRNLILNQSFLNFITLDAKHKLNRVVQILFETKCRQQCYLDVVQKISGKKSVLLEIILLDDRFMRICLIDHSLMDNLSTEFLELKKKQIYLIISLIRLMKR